MYKYSDELIKRTILHFKIKYNLIIDEEKADEYLDSFANLFESFIDFTEK